MLRRYAVDCVTAQDTGDLPVLVVMRSHATYSLLPKAWLPISADAAKVRETEHEW